MVVFTCNHCGETLHKPKVEKHYQFTCRNYKSVTCVDCFKDFRNEEYVAHTKCITEDERYAAKGTYKNGIVKKGEVKQESWLEMIKSICDTEKNLKPSLRNLLNTISEYSNVPRKKQKFMNFIKSSSGNRANLKEVEEVWDIIEKYKAKKNSNNQGSTENGNNKKVETNDEEKNNGITEFEHQSKKRINDENTEEYPKKKKKYSEQTEEEGSQENKKNPKKSKKQKSESFNSTTEVYTEENDISEKLENSKKKKNKQEASDSTEEKIQEPHKFNFKEQILQILAEKKNIAHKKLQKKVLKAYLNIMGESDCEEKVIKKFNKKLKKIPNVGIEDDRVVLQQ